MKNYFDYNQLKSLRKHSYSYRREIKHPEISRRESTHRRNFIRRLGFDYNHHKY